ncbi:MAG: ATP-binding protein [Thiothrix sp.]|uniref:ATP-binding protein n=1 Tax=Thiothrix sp. TaxID=1032 RepID=UPI00262614F8|nr:ATP-binding protein [Thiothrix sp.]MDD5391895.1 ATP-binding protein [Thiothrix sp.]
MIARNLKAQLIEYLKQFPAIALLGPRQAGKTTLAETLMHQNLPSVYLDLESPSDRHKLTDPEAYLSQHEHKLVILDEVQRMPELFQPLRSLIDRGRRKGISSGRFLLLGSASGDLLRQSGESLAGRIAYLELPPFQLTELAAEQENTLWVRGGFPNSLLAKTDKQSLVWRQNLISTYLEREIPSYGVRIPAETLRRLWTMLAHNQGGMLNLSQLGKNLMIDTKTVSRYLDLLVDLLLVRRLLPWHSNVGKRLVKSPKIYIRDSGLVHALLGIADFDNLLGHPVVGNSWEGFVIENLINAAPFNTVAGFYRSSNGAEIDLLLDVPNQGLWAIEVKRSNAAKPRQGFYAACEDLQPSKRLMVCPGNDRYPIGNGVEAVGVRALLDELNRLND